ncbi:phosphoribosyltransferase [Acerihabitans sp. TG2]|uniref:phosphoribosyltransferase n=1 Tax=Acerihabitans sp. TG2 TaxID=3096008 RepID=UPI002B23C4A6|nr:phosphoribosyltransferase [Acerihabitans sp. TG2]MEA9390259.1 phosphoribosyltransferase [Acerihabitans sp. TG2]
MTNAEGNPTIENIGDLRIYSVFRRLRLSRKMQRNRQQRQVGDNCPLIYALKAKEGLTADITSIVRLSKSFARIAEKISQLEPQGYQLVISMPSAHQISKVVGKRFARRFSAPHIFTAFRKITVDEAFRLVDRADVSVEEAKSLAYQVKLQSREVGLAGDFSLKGISPALREAIPPLAWNVVPQLNFHPQRILLVDDLLASGTTLNTAACIVQQHYPGATVHAACLFSSAGR